MIVFVIVCSIILIWILERLSRRDDLRHLHVTFRTDMDLVEPGEALTLRYTVYNTSPFPLLYVGLGLQLDDAVDVAEETPARLLTRNFTGTQLEHRFWLLPHRRFSGRVRLTLKRRGLVDLGKCYLETGDLLGLKPVIRSRDIGIRVICTCRRCQEEDLRPLGGLLGEVSVPRFIHEDPSMVTGYREYPGREPMKQISWLQTARAGQLMVRQFDHTVDRNVTVVVNMEAAHRRIMEQCLRLTRTVCEQLEDRHVPYAVYSNGDLRNLEEGLGRGHLFFLLRRIGLSAPTGYQGFPELVDYCLARRRTGSSYIVVTPALSETGEAALERLRRSTDMEVCVLNGEEKGA